MASAKTWSSMCSEPSDSVSVLKKPASEPLPYWIAKSVPLPCAREYNRWSCVSNPLVKATSAQLSASLKHATDPLRLQQQNVHAAV